MSEEDAPEVPVSQTPQPDDNEGRARLDSWDRKAWEGAVYADAGVSDFSEEAKKRAQEGSEYEDYMRRFAEDDRPADVRYIDQEEKGERRDAVDTVIFGNDELRLMNRLAVEISKLRQQPQTPEVAEQIKLQEDILNRKLLSYNFDSNNPLDDAVYDRIVDRTVPQPEDVGGQVPAVEVQQDDKVEGAAVPEDSTTGEADQTTEVSSPEQHEEVVDSEDTKSEGEENTESPVEGPYGYPANPEAGADLAVLSPMEHEAVDALLGSRDKYAEYTAEDRNHFWGRFLASDTWFARQLKKIPGVKWAADSISQLGGFAQEMDMARGNYEQCLKDYVGAIDARLKLEAEEGRELTEEYRKQVITIALAQEDAMLEDKIVEHQESVSNAASRLSNWWMRQKGWTGTLKKAGLIIGGGLLIGAGAGALVGAIAGAGALTGLAGAVAGGGFGAGVAGHVTSRRANSFVDQEQTTTYADAASERNHEQKMNVAETRINQFGNPDSAAEAIIKENERITDEEVARNRRELKINTSLGITAGGLAGAVVGNWVGGITHPVSQPSQTPNVGNDGSPNTSPQPNPNPQPQPGPSGAETAPNVAPHTYSYGYSEAPETLLRHVAPDQLGQNLRGDQAYRLINQLYERLGDHVFSNVDLTLHGPGNVWIQNPGGSTTGLTKEAIAIAKQLIASGSI